MTALHERYSDLFDDSHDLDLARVIAGLDALGKASAASVPPEQDRQIRAALAAHAHDTAQPPARRLRPRFPTLSGRLASLAAAALIVLAGVVGYSRFQAPSAVSAAQLLQRAAHVMAPPVAGQVVHQAVVYDGYAANGSPLTHVTVELWARFAAGGSVDRLNSTLVADGRVEEHEVLDDTTYWAYSGPANRVLQEPAQPFHPDTAVNVVAWPKLIMNEPQNLAETGREVLANAAGEQPSLLPRQTLDGRTVDVVQIVHREPDIINGGRVTWVPGAPRSETMTFYLDADTGVLVRLDEQDRDSQGNVVGTSTLDVRTYEIMAQAKAPAGLFSFTPPPGASVERCNAATPPVCTPVR